MSDRKTVRRPANPAPPVWPALRRLLVLLGFGLLVVGIFAVGHVLTDPDNLPIDIVEIEGKLMHLDKESLRRRLEPLVDSGFLQVDVEAVVAAAQAMDWVESAEVQRVWPDRLVLRIREERPVARWNGNQLMNARGEIFHEEEKRQIPGLPNLIGEEQDRELLFTRLGQFQQLLQPDLGSIARLELEHQGSWRIDLLGGGVLHLLADHPVRDLVDFLRIWPQVEKKPGQSIRSIDLRYEQGFAIWWQPGSEQSES